MPTRLHHGTSVAALPTILAVGIVPRGRDKARNNWRHTVGSNPDAVYLTDTYALHFAQCAAKGEDLAIVEVDVPSIAHNLQADEDAIEQVYRGHDDLPADWGMKRRTIYYRARAHQYEALASIAVLGTCAHRGTIPVAAITRVVTIPRERVVEFIVYAHDPLVSTLNHQFMGPRHKQFHRWLFGDEPQCDACPTLTRDGVAVAEYTRPIKEKRYAM